MHQLRAAFRFRHLLTSITRRNNRPFSSSSAASESNEAFFSSSPASHPSPPPPPPPSPVPNVPKPFSRILKAGIFLTLPVLAATGYVTYAYTADEVDEKTKGFRSPTNHHGVGIAENLSYSLYSVVMTAPAKAVDLYLDVRRLIEERVQELAEPTSDKLLPDLDPAHQQMGVLTLVLDLRETLIHNEWKRERGWCTFKRPGLDAFLEHLSQFYEIVVYTDELYLDQIMDKLVPKGVTFFLSRSATKYLDGKHYRDLSKLNRNPSKILYVSGHALENCLQPENCVPIQPWRKEADDTTLIDLIPFLEFVGSYRPEDIRSVLASYRGKDIPSEFILRSKEHQRSIVEKKRQAFPWKRN